VLTFISIVNAPEGI